MRRSLWITATALVAMFMSSCTAMFTASSLGSSDLYNTDNRVQVANRLKAEAEAEAAEAAARQAQWEARTAEAYAKQAEAEYYASISENPSYVNIVADDYESAYARRLYGFNSPTYNLPSSYFSLQATNAMRYASAYDPAYYNIMISGDQVWVEPRYVTSMFGSWGATNITFGLYSSPWMYGWRYNVDPFYYSWWGYPRYSWYDWNWNVCYHNHYYDWWWNYPYYGHHHHHHGYYPGYHNNPPRPPQHRPNYDRPGHRPDNRPNHNLATGTGAGAGRPISNLNGSRDNAGSRYTSPTSNRNYGKVEGTTNRPNRGGSVSTGVNTNSSYRVSDTKINTGVSTTVGTSTVGGNRDSGTRNNSTTSTGSNFRQGGTSSRATGGNSSVGTSNNRGTVRVSGGTTSTQRSSGTTTTNTSRGNSRNSSGTVSSSSSRNTNSSYRSGSSSSSRNSSSSYGTASSASRNTTISGSHSSTSRSSGSYSSGGSSRGGSTSSRR